MYTSEDYQAAKDALTARTDKDADGWMNQCANYLLVDLEFNLIRQAIPIIAQLRVDGWLEQGVDPRNTYDRIVG